MERMDKFKTILVALDGSKLTEQVIASLTQISLNDESKVIFAHVISSNEYEPGSSADRPHGVLEDLPYRQIEKQLQIYQSQLPCQSELEIVSGDAAQEIVRLANIYHADLIIIGSRGLKGITRILQGSVSSQVVEEAPCSVLVVKNIDN